MHTGSVAVPLRGLMAIAKKIELVANLAIIVAALLLCVSLVNRSLLSDQQPVSSKEQLPEGTKLVLSGVDWSKSDQTLLLVLSDACHFCTESGEFYRRLAQERAKATGLRLIAIMPQEVDRGRAYLDRLGVSVDEVRQAPLSVLRVAGTPTLIAVNGAGLITASWVGKLSAEKEAEVLERLQRPTTN